MKRIAISLGSISLFMLNTGHAEPTKSMEVFNSSLATEIPNSVDPEELGEDDLSFLEADPFELEEELLSLEQELAEQENAAAADLSAARKDQDSPLEASSQASAEQENILVEKMGTALSSPVQQQVAEQVPDAKEPQALEEKATVNSENPEAAPLSTAQSPDLSSFAALDKSDADTMTSDTLEEFDDLESDDFESDIVAEQENAVSDEVLGDSDAVAIEKELSSSAAPVIDVEVVKVETVQEVLYPIAEVSKQEVAKASPNKASSATAAVFRSPSSKMEISFQQVFAGSPLIYGILLFLSIVSVVIWLYNYLALRINAKLSDTVLKNVRNKLVSNHYDEALSVCRDEKNFFCKMMASGISSRKYGLQFMLESMKSEGKRASVSFWQRLNLLQDVAIVAPMLGLLGTVLGMFYAFYDLNRSFESISTLFDGLGISVGTTVAGIFVAILAMVLHSMSKFRLVKALSRIENEALTLAHLIDHKSHG